MVAYNLHYFNLTGRAELIRLVFTATGQKFTDTRIGFGDWAAIKPGTPFGSLPYLDVDGKPLGQTKAIIRYVAHEHGIGGKDAFEQALVDSVVEATRDITDNLSAYQFGDASQKEANLTKLTKTTLPTLLGALEKFITKHGKTGFSVGDKLTTADLAIFDAVDQVQADKSVGVHDATAEYPKIKEVIATVLANPTISSYLEKR